MTRERNRVCEVKEEERERERKFVREKEIEKKMFCKLQYSVGDPFTTHQAFPSVSINP